MSDGANFGMKADESMQAVLGGDEPDVMTDEAFEKMIREAPMVESFDYGGCANACARLVLEAYEKYPVMQGLPMEARYLKFANGKADFDNFHAIDTTLYDVMRKLHSDESWEYEYIFSPLSGFMWGWAVNAARHILKLDSVQNPAIVEL